MTKKFYKLLYLLLFLVLHPWRFKMPILLNKKNIQGLSIAERVNYDFVKATTLTDLLVFFCTTFLTFSFLGFPTFTFSSFFSPHKYLGRSSPLIAFLAILYIFVALFTSLFHTPEHFLQVNSPWHKIFPLLYGFWFPLTLHIFQPIFSNFFQNT